MEVSRKFKARMFYRVFFIYSAIIFIAMAALLMLLWHYYSDFLIQKELDEKAYMLERVEGAFKDKDDFVKHGVINLYQQRYLMEDLIYALENTYQDYLHHRLDNFLKSDSFMPHHFELYIRNYFMSDPDVVHVEIYNQDETVNYSYTFDYFTWVMPEDHFFKVVHEINNPVSIEKIGSIEVYYSYQVIDQLLDTLFPEIKSTLYILDDEKELLYSKGSETHLPKEKWNQAGEVKVRGKTYFIMSKDLMDRDQKMVALLSRSAIDSLKIYGFRIVMITLLLTAVAIALPYYALKNYSIRVKQLVETMKQVENGNLEVRVPIGAEEDDLTVIAESFNQTVEKLNEYLETVYFSRLNQKEAELAHLQAQINPHFLYNTLEGIRMKALAEGGMMTSKMIVLLSRYFRLSLRTTEWVGVQEELMHVEKYLELFKMRFPDQLKTQMICDPEAKDLYMIPFVLQPLIENFLVHGFNRTSYYNELKVQVMKKDDLMIEIIDNGSGIGEEKLKEIQDGLEVKNLRDESIGLYNVHHRIKLKFGGHYGISIFSIPDEKTVITLRIPVVKEVNDDNSHASR